MVNLPLTATLHPVTIVFNMVGFNTRVVVTRPGQPLDIYLEENIRQLDDEVVVTALGISREKKSLGYTTQELKAMNSLTRKKQTC